MFLYFFLQKQDPRTWNLITEFFVCHCLPRRCCNSKLSLFHKMAFKYWCYWYYVYTCVLSTVSIYLFQVI